MNGINAPLGAAVFAVGTAVLLRAVAAAGDRRNDAHEFVGDRFIRGPGAVPDNHSLY